MAYLALACRFLLAAVFVLSVGGKTLRRSAFSQFDESLRELPLIPARWTVRVAILTVGAEALAAVTAVLPWTAPAGLGLATLVLLTFTAAVTISLARGAGVSCRCFGGSTARPLGLRHVIRNLGLTTVAAVGLVVTVAGPHRHPSVFGGVLVAFAACVAALLVAAADDLIDLVTGPPATVTSPRSLAED